MPTLVRLLFILFIIALAIYGAIFSLANPLAPTPQITTITIPNEALVPRNNAASEQK